MCNFHVMYMWYRKLPAEELVIDESFNSERESYLLDLNVICGIMNIVLECDCRKTFYKRVSFRIT